MPFPVLTAVHEHVVFAGMGVEVAVEVDGPFLKNFGHQFLFSKVRKISANVLRSFNFIKVLLLAEVVHTVKKG
jgi:hypothetical protein